MKTRCEKLLRLALCSAASNGESESAAIAFVRQARADGETFETMFPPKKPKSASLPFGMHAGQPLDELDDGYLLWAYENMKSLSPALKRALRDEIARRGGN